MATNYLEVLKMLAAIGLGWSALPRTMIGMSDQPKSDQPERVAYENNPLMQEFVGHHADRLLAFVPGAVAVAVLIVVQGEPDVPPESLKSIEAVRGRGQCNEEAAYNTRMIRKMLDEGVEKVSVRTIWDKGKRGLPGRWN